MVGAFLRGRERAIFVGSVVGICGISAPPRRELHPVTVLESGIICNRLAMGSNQAAAPVRRSNWRPNWPKFAPAPSAPSARLRARQWRIDPTTSNSFGCPASMYSRARHKASTVSSKRSILPLKDARGDCVVV